MDIFLMVGKLVDQVERYNYQVGNNGLYHHLLILIQLEKEDIKHPFPFKYNHEWLDKEYLRLLITNNGNSMIPVDEIQLCFSFFPISNKLRSQLYGA